jgi:hypothetical protein
VARHRSGSAPHLTRDLLARQAFENPELDNPAKCGINLGEPIQNILDFGERMFAP